MYPQIARINGTIEVSVDDYKRLLRELDRWRSLGEAILQNHPAEDAADGTPCLEVWRKEIQQLLPQD